MPLALVTGASSGIGADLCRELAADGYHLILTARSPTPMHALASELAQGHGTQSTIITADLTEPGAAMRLKADIDQRGLVVDALINNAGFGEAGPFYRGDAGQITGMVQVNITALTDLTRAFLPGMVERKSGKIMLVASTAAFQPNPSMAVYGATKAYVLSLGEALAHELRATGVTVTTLCPGATATNFAARAKTENSFLFKVLPTMTSKDVARLGYAGFKAGKPVVITGIANKFTAALGPLTPRAISLPIANWLMGAH